MIGGVQKKVLLDLDDGSLTPNKEFVDLYLGRPNNWKLVRERDGLTKCSEKVMWIEFNADGKFKSKHEFIGIGYSLLMSPFTQAFTWQTSPVTEVIEAREDYIKFKTGNSNYELFKLS